MSVQPPSSSPADKGKPFTEIRIPTIVTAESRTAVPITIKGNTITLPDGTSYSIPNKITDKCTAQVVSGKILLIRIKPGNPDDNFNLGDPFAGKVSARNIAITFTPMEIKGKKVYDGQYTIYSGEGGSELSSGFSDLSTFLINDAYFGMSSSRNISLLDKIHLLVSLKCKLTPAVLERYRGDAIRDNRKPGSYGEFREMINNLIVLAQALPEGNDKQFVLSRLHASVAISYEQEGNIELAKKNNNTAFNYASKITNDRVRNEEEQYFSELKTKGLL